MSSPHDSDKGVNGSGGHLGCSAISGPLTAQWDGVIVGFNSEKKSLR